MPAPFSQPVLALMALGAVALLIPAMVGAVLACPAMPRPPGVAVKRECDRVGASERSAARLSHTQSVSIARTPKRFEAQER